jgi:hypothetical protein
MARALTSCYSSIWPFCADRGIHEFRADVLADKSASSQALDQLSGCLIGALNIREKCHPVNVGPMCG